MCEICHSGGDNDAMLLCDRCSCGFHMYCLDPPLHSVPAGDWFCSACLKESFGFGSTRVFKFHQYERQAHAFKHAFFESLMETGTAKLSKKSKQMEISRSVSGGGGTPQRRLHARHSGGGNAHGCGCTRLRQRSAFSFPALPASPSPSPSLFPFCPLTPLLSLSLCRSRLRAAQCGGARPVHGRGAPLGL